MCSASAPADESADLTGRARIRDAAIARFATDGIAGASLRAIADDAGFSPALVIHHFGSKEGLRTACDQHVAALIREQKHATMTQGPTLDPMPALRQQGEGPPLLRYLARRLVEGPSEVAALVDELVDDAVEYMAQGERTGVLRPTDHPRGRAVVLTLWSLGALVLHEHASRLLGIDLIDDPAGAAAYFRPAGELLSRGVFTEEAFAQAYEAFHRTEEDGS